MSILPDETIGTITVTDADGKTDVAVEFEFTDITSTGEVSLGVIPKTGPAAGVSIHLKGKAKMDGSIYIYIGIGLESVALVNVYNGSLVAADPKLASDIKVLAKEVKAKKRADREYILASQEEMVARTGAKTVISNVADNVGKLSGLLPANQKIKVASDILNASAASGIYDQEASGTYDLEADTLVKALSAAQDAAQYAGQDAAQYAGQDAADAGQDAAQDAVTALTALVTQQITELQEVSSAKIAAAKTRKVAAKKTVGKVKIVLTKAVSKLGEKFVKK